jgi:hypothetical protein
MEKFGSGIENLDLGSGINNPDPQHCITLTTAKCLPVSGLCCSESEYEWSGGEEGGASQGPALIVGPTGCGKVENSFIQGCKKPGFKKNSPVGFWVFLVFFGFLYICPEKRVFNLFLLICRMHQLLLECRFYFFLKYS